MTPWVLACCQSRLSWVGCLELCIGFYVASLNAYISAVTHWIDMTQLAMDSYLQGLIRMDSFIQFHETLRLQWGFKCHRVLQGSRPLTTSFLASTWWFLVLHEWFQKMMSCSERLHVRVWDIYKPFWHVLDLFRGSACSENSQGPKIGVKPKNLNVSSHATFLVPIKRLLPRIIESSLAMLAVWNMGGVGLEEST